MIASIATFFESPPAGVEVLGYLLVVAVIVELVVGKRRLDFRKRFPRTHAALAWSMAAVLAIHSIIGVGHSVVGYLVKK